jgi:glycine/D-amino acid oxidase-like deaminating enzyme
MNVLDENAILGKPPNVSNLYLANGFSGHGMQHSPAAGRGLAELILLGEYRTLDLRPLGYGRLLQNQPLRELIAS